MRAYGSAVVLGVLLCLGVGAVAADKTDKTEKKEKADRKKAKPWEILSGVMDVAASAGGVDYESEVAIGESLALEGFRRYGMPVEDQGLQRYVNLVGNAAARNSTRPDIPYRFVVVKSPLYNAFSCPGGIIFVSSQLVKSLKDESELAGVLAHEVGHVAYKHALQSIQRAKFFEGVGKITAATMKGNKGQQFRSMIGDLQTVLFDKGLDKNMEYEADQAALETSYRTGYDPGGFLRVLQMLKREEASAQKAGSWFSTHPPLESRIERVSARKSDYPDASKLAVVSQRFSLYRKRLP